MIKALGALNEKQKSGRKARGDASGSARLPRRRFVCGERIERAEESGDLSDFAVERRVLVWGVRSEATDAPPRA